MEALKQLANNPNIIIRKADKGSCVVVQDTQQYLDECFKQLSDRHFYSRELYNLTDIHNKKVHSLVNQLLEKGSISEDVAKYMKISNPRIAAFYTIPKIHKNVNPPPGRPILSANDSPTERISTFEDHFLSPFVLSMKSCQRHHPFRQTSAVLR